MKLGWVSTFNIKCGIATYSEHILHSIHKQNEAIIFAEYSNDLVKPDQTNVIRCWHRGQNLNTLADIVIQHGIDVLVVQYHPVLLEYSALNSFIARIKQHNIRIVCMMHSIPWRPEYGIAWNSIPNLSICDNITVHNNRDYELLYQLHNLRDNVCIHLHGINLKSSFKISESNREIPLIGCFGFSLPNKGIWELLHAAVILRQNNFLCNLRLLNAEYPAGNSAEYVKACRQFIIDNKLENCVAYQTEFLSDDDSARLLSECDFLINPYQHTTEPVSGSVRHLLATGLPVAITPSPIFEDIKYITYQLNGTDPASMAYSIPSIWHSIKTRDYVYRAVMLGSSEWRTAQSYDSLAVKFLKLLEGKNV